MPNVPEVVVSADEYDLLTSALDAAERSNGAASRASSITNGGHSSPCGPLAAISCFISQTPSRYHHHPRSESKDELSMTPSPVPSLVLVLQPRPCFPAELHRHLLPLSLSSQSIINSSPRLQRELTRHDALQFTPDMYGQLRWLCQQHASIVLTFPLGLAHSIHMLLVRQRGDISPQTVSSTIPNRLWSQLFPFQQSGVLRAICALNGRVLIADDMGLGKTVQALAIAEFYRLMSCTKTKTAAMSSGNDKRGSSSDSPVVLVLCPATLRSSWAGAIVQWIPAASHQSVAVATTPSDLKLALSPPTAPRDAWDAPRPLTHIVCTYDLLARISTTTSPSPSTDSQHPVVQVSSSPSPSLPLSVDCFNRSNKYKAPYIVIADECHNLRNVHTARARGAMPFITSATIRILVSGTPALSRPADIYSVLHALLHDEVKSNNSNNDNNKNNNNANTNYSADHNESTIPNNSINNNSTDTTNNISNNTNSIDNRNNKNEVEHRLDSAHAPFLSFLAFEQRYVHGSACASRAHELNAILACVMVRRSKCDVQVDLPPKRRVRVVAHVAAERLSHVTQMLQQAQDLEMQYKPPSQHRQMFDSSQVATYSRHSNYSHNRYNGRSGRYQYQYQRQQYGNNSFVVNRTGTSARNDQASITCIKQQREALFTAMYAATAELKLGPVITRLYQLLQLDRKARSYMSAPSHEDRPPGVNEDDDDDNSEVQNQERKKRRRENRAKILVFAHHVRVLDAIDQFLDARDVEHIRIDGMTACDRRDTLVQQFQDRSAIQVALLSINVAATGITLTKADTVLFAELCWVPALLVQAENRAHRIGRVGAVTMEYLVIPGSLDDLMMSALTWKAGLVFKMVDDGHSRGATSTRGNGNSDGHGDVAGTSASNNGLNFRQEDSVSACMDCVELSELEVQQVVSHCVVASAALCKRPQEHQSLETSTASTVGTFPSEGASPSPGF